MPITPICWSCRVCIAATQPCLQRRLAGSLQARRQPARKVLSAEVAQKYARGPAGGNAAGPQSISPFGAMNKTEVDLSRLRRPVKSKSAPRRDYKGSPTTSSRSKSKNADSFKALKMQRALSPVSYERRSEVKQVIGDKGTFADFRLLPSIAESITQLLQWKSDAAPSPIQRLAIPALLGHKKEFRPSGRDATMQQFLLAAETGSGKTLAYVLPIIDALKRAEALEKEEQSRAGVSAPEQDALFDLEQEQVVPRDPATARPRAIILVPTSELVDQVGSVLKLLSHTVKYRAAMISASYSAQVIRNRLFTSKGIDIVVSTPHLLASIVDQDPNLVARVTHLVVDEADSLLDRSFSPITRAIVDRATPSLKQLILCSATIPRNLDGFLRKHYPDMHRLTTPNLHAIPRRIQLSVVDIEGDPYKNNRNMACADTVWNIGREASVSANAGGDKVERVIVFVNERESTEEVTNFLKSKGIDATALNRDATDRQSSNVLAEFTGSGEASSKNKSTEVEVQPPVDGAKRNALRLDGVKVLVMTDIGSRGIDTLEVKNVILYDVPHTSIDFIHRLGRVGRMNKRGRGFVIVGKGDRRDIVREIRTGMFMGKALI